MLNQINQMMARALQCFQSGNHDEAELILIKVLGTQPKNFDALHILGVLKGIKNQHHEALEFFRKALRVNSNDSFLNFNIAKAFSEIGEDEKSLKFHSSATRLNPNHPEGWVSYGKSLSNLKRFDESLNLFSKAVALNPEYAEAWTNQGCAFKELGRFQQALDSFDKSIKINPHLAETWSNRGITLLNLKRVGEALASYDMAITIRPEYAEAYYNRGVALNALKLHEEALASSDRAIELKPGSAEAWSNRGNALGDLKRHEEALASYERSIELKPDYAEVWNNRGIALIELKRLEEALASYERAIAIKPDYDYLLGTQLHTKMKMCDWQDFEANVENLLLRIGEGKKSSASFAILALTDSLSLQRKASEIWMNDKHPPNHSLGFIPKLRRKEKIKIGYYSEDFREHPVSYLAVELFELHDKNKFELIAFYYGPPDSSNMHKRVSSAFNEFIDIRLKSDKEVAELSRLMEIDIAIDLSGLTGNERTGIFAYRAAPVQLSYLGYLGTMGVEYYDYLIADKTTIPTEYHQYFKEKIVYLPSYQVNDSKRLISDKVFEKTELNLPLNAFVFCCFNNNYKITPPTFDGWMRILNAVPDSVLVLYAENQWAEANLKLEAEKRGVSKTRLVFGGRIERSEYLARYRLADLFLDTLPYNAGTTASDALWAGLPVLTCMGESFASRVAVSVLNAIELPELVTTTQEQYEANAIELAPNPAKLRAIKDKIEQNRLTTALFDTPRFTKHIEAAYTQMYERYQTDLPPDHIYIQD